jgi:hypothetical protein
LQSLWGLALVEMNEINQMCRLLIVNQMSKEAAR